MTRQEILDWIGKLEQALAQADHEDAEYAGILHELNHARACLADVPAPLDIEVTVDTADLDAAVAVLDALEGDEL